jgi:hypothetical protein
MHRNNKNKFIPLRIKEMNIRELRYILVALGFELRPLHLLGRCSIA